jgi:uncharacterized membrane protein YfcA
MNLEPWQWILAVVGALLVGISKTGVAGLGLLAVVMFAQVFPAKQATGLVLPLLICGDVIAVASYRRHTQWHYLWKLFPWTAAGVLAGFFALGRIDDRQARVMIGGIVLVLLALHLVRRKRSANAGGVLSPRDDVSKSGVGAPRPQPAAAGDQAFHSEHGIWFAPTVGVLAGFTTLVANAAGPLMVIYFLAMRLPKMEFVGTGAVFFLLLNLFKVPFMVRLGLINGPSLTINLWLVPAVLIGAYLGRKILVKMDQRLFENVALALSAIAGLKLLW